MFFADKSVLSLFHCFSKKFRGSVKIQRIIFRDNSMFPPMWKDVISYVRLKCCFE